ncbi:uncharacterized protein si:cabz01007794.1 isoform X3 [Takifugu flavidus]|uniref:uncharacterized protein si:cabz01007794.1 isoform X2 n=1 Tax=Takifugu flavidus TaxID=433684 RepID=UPI002544A5E1|nr:uncharacterized protein si:cabz01007794.1 isoform X2 [Takifugu flavidus]XP_056884297.1 uncharacterized protein si:cabz01007794.1 isoform X3 [Takifugu flavidus]
MVQEELSHSHLRLCQEKLLEQDLHLRTTPENKTNLFIGTKERNSCTGMDSKLYFTVTLVVLAWVSVATTQAETNSTASTNMTTAPPLTPNNTVTPLETNLNNSGCGTQKLCVNEPANCDPGSGSCSFFSARQKSGQNFEFALAGETDGYIAAVLSSDTTLGGNDTTYVCFNKNGSVKFTGASLNNNQLTKQNVSANNVRGKVNGRKIQCVFDATLPACLQEPRAGPLASLLEPTTTAQALSGPANTVIRTEPAVDLSSPNASVPNLATATANTTAAPSTTASTSVTAAPPLTPNNTVTPLETNLNNSGCGTQNLCVNEPANCDPGSGSCNFFSARQKSGQNFGFALAGETDGYIAAVLSSDTTLGGSDTTYVCFNNNGNVEFTGASLNNNQLTRQNVNANNVRGRVNGRKIQCVFDATLPALSARTTSRTIGVITGTYNNSAGTFGAANTVIRTDPVDLSSPNATVQNLATASTTAAPSTTASTSVTAAPPLTPNNTVTPLETNLNNSGCGTQNLCVNEPANCDPGSGSCNFFSARRKSGQNFGFALAGETDGYIAAVLSSDTTLGGSDTTYVCFNNNGNVEFTGASLNNNQLTKQNVSANNVRGKVNGTKIQCVFDATLPALSARTTSRTIGVITGTYDNSAGTFGAANTVIRTNAVDLSSPTATVQNLATVSTTASPNATTNNAMLFRQTLIQALFISAGVMGLAVL